MMNKNFCHSCLKECTSDFCSGCRKLLFDGKSVKAELPFAHTDFIELKLRAGSRLSISGVQIKHSMDLIKNKPSLTEKGGKYIIKPIPNGNFRYLKYLPANEHITMLIAGKVFGINTAANALCRFSSGQPVYITKRFDLLPGGRKCLVEDFAQISGKTAENSGGDYKYSGSYEQIGKLIRKYVSAADLETEKFFKLVVFNYTISNGDAHLKNFSLYRNEEYGDYLLTPAYDLVCTRLHTPYESDMALELFEDKFESEDFEAGSKYLRGDFLLFGERLGIPKQRIEKILYQFLESKEGVEGLVGKSFLPDELKKEYLNYFKDKLGRLT